MSNNTVYLIAEAGVNHNGNVETAIELVKSAADAGADAVKFQTFRADALVTVNANKADYQQSSSGKTQYEMLKALELTHAEFLRLHHYCSELGIDFLTTAFDAESFEFLSTLSVKKLKIPSGEITNLPLIIDHAKLDLPIILSTGMCSLHDIEMAMAAVAWGRRNKNEYPQNTQDLLADYERNINDTRQFNLGLKVTILHCTSAYPAPLDSLNLNAIKSLADEFNVPVGYSDHSIGNVASIMAISMGAKIIEKHFTLDQHMQGPDHKASMNPNELKNWVSQCRQSELALGNGVKATTEVEASVKKVARKSVVAKTAIKKGEIYSLSNLCIKRPGEGLAPEKFFELIGTHSTRSYDIDDCIE